MKEQTRVREFLVSSDGQRKFLEWLDNPVTQMLLAASRERARPMPSDQGAKYALGLTVGANSVVDYLESPVGSPGVSPLSGLVPDYGARELLKKGDV